MNPDAETPAEPTAPPELPQEHGATPDEPFPEIPPMIAKALETFRRDLPELMKRHNGKWVAYHGDKQLGIARKSTKLYQMVNRLGLRDDEYVVEWIGPQMEEDDYEWLGCREFDEEEIFGEDGQCPQS